MLTEHGVPAVPSQSSGTRRPGPRRVLRLALAGLAVVAIVIAAVFISQGGGRATTVPTPLARNFRLAELGHPGATVSLAGYQGKPLIINFFASWCSPCQRETPMLARFYTAQRGTVIVVGIDANDQQAAAQRFAAKAGIRYPVGVDPYPSATTTSYGVLALPQTFFLNAQHRIVSHVVGMLTMKDLTAGVALMERHTHG